MSFFTNIFKPAEHPLPRLPPPDLDSLQRHGDVPIDNDALLHACGLRWVKITPSNNVIPTNAIEGGWTWQGTITQSKVPLYVGRIDLGDGHMVPGKAGGGEFHYSQSGKEYKATSGYEVLVSMDSAPKNLEVRWIPCHGRLRDARGAVSCKDAHGKRLFIARRDHKNGEHIGFLAEDSDTFLFSWGGGEVSSGFCDVLVVCVKPEENEHESPRKVSSDLIMVPVSGEHEHEQQRARSPSPSPSPVSAEPKKAALLALPHPTGPSPDEQDDNGHSPVRLSFPAMTAAASAKVSAEMDANNVSGDMLKDIENLEKEMEVGADDEEPGPAGLDHPHNVDEDALSHALETSISLQPPKPIFEHAVVHPDAPHIEASLAKEDSSSISTTTTSPEDIQALFPPTSQPAGKRTDPSQLYANPKVADAVRKARERSELAAQAGDKSVFAQMGSAVVERGEKLSQLALKTEAMESSAKGFLDAIKEYNKEQEAKGWFGGA